MLRASIYISYFFISLFLFGCSPSITEPTITRDPTTQIFQPTLMEMEPRLKATASPSANGSEPVIPSETGEVLNNAIKNLMNATSFELSVHDVRAYHTIDINGETKLIYGEFNNDYQVIRFPALKVHGIHEYRYDPEAEFLHYESYVYQENGKYFSLLDEASDSGAVEEIDLMEIEPISGDVYQTLSTYSDHAEFVTERDGIAVYIIEHPAWYKLKGAIGFANLGFLYLQENGEQLVEQYVRENYPNVRTILFTIYVSVDEQVITKVEVNDSDFMVSLWAEIDRALIRQGAKAENLTRYEVMDPNGGEYHFSNYNKAQDLKIPSRGQIP